MIRKYEHAVAESVRTKRRTGISAPVPGVGISTLRGGPVGPQAFSDPRSRSRFGSSNCGGTGTAKSSGLQNGWVKVDPRTQAGMAQLLAHVAAGKPAVASTRDHIAFVRPNQVGGLTPATLGQVSIAQAGSKNFTAGRLTTGWPPARLNEIRFFLHE